MSQCNLVFGGRILSVWWGVDHAIRLRPNAIRERQGYQFDWRRMMQQNCGQQSQVCNYRYRHRTMIAETSCHGLDLVEHAIDTLT